MSRKLPILVSLAVALVWAGCTSHTSVTGNKAPHDVLAQYIGAAFAVKSPGDLETLGNFTTGSALQELKTLKGDPALFKKTFIDQKIESASSLRIRDERKIDDSNYSITYELSYRDKSANTQDLVTTKKHALFVKDGQGDWRIAEVKNLKTFVEHTADETIPGKALEHGEKQ